MRFKKKSNDLDVKDEKANPNSPNFITNFLEDWKNVRDRHEKQQFILDQFFDGKKQYLFIRAGRKFSKTTVLIDIIWRFAMENPGCVIYFCYPTITQGIEVCWEERRLQTCDSKNDYMFNKYVKKVDDNKHIVWFINGSFVKVIGTWSEARGRGTQPDLLLTDEIQDCSEQYLVAADANLAAKNGRSVMSGTPPPIRNHYHDWEDMIRSNPKGEVFHFTSYDNTKLPHLAEWLDNKRKELVKINKEDVFIREYLAEDCFVSSARALPDPEFLEDAELNISYSKFGFTDRVPLLVVSVYEHYICMTFTVLIKKKMAYVIESLIIKQVWDQSYNKLYENASVKDKIVKLERACGNRMRKIIWDETNSFRDVIRGFVPVRKDFKWQDRGIPLLREMMNEKKIAFGMSLDEFGPECQKLLVDEKIKPIEKDFPFVCNLAIIANEYFQREKVSIESLKEFDKYAALREMGLPVPQKKKLRTIFSSRDWRK